MEFLRNFKVFQGASVDFRMFQWIQEASVQFKGDLRGSKVFVSVTSRRFNEFQEDLDSCSGPYQGLRKVYGSPKWHFKALREHLGSFSVV